jgi:hypothetical protein
MVRVMEEEPLYGEVWRKRRMNLSMVRVMEEEEDEPLSMVEEEEPLVRVMG